MTNPKEEYRERGPLTNREIEDMVAKAEEIRNPYFRLRTKALLGLLKKWGKRSSENASLKLEDVKVDAEYLHVTFTLRKKHKKGLFQYLKKLREDSPESLNKPHTVLVEEWKAWTQTSKGHTVKREKRTKKVSVADKYAKHVLEYLAFLRDNHPSAEYLFPSGRAVFGQGYTVIGDKHLSGRQLLRLIKPLNPEAWLHLFRENIGKEIAESDNSLQAVYKVRDMLDLEEEKTAYLYVRRYGEQEAKAET